MFAPSASSQTTSAIVPGLVAIFLVAASSRAEGEANPLLAPLGEAEAEAEPEAEAKAEPVAEPEAEAIAQPEAVPELTAEEEAALAAALAADADTPPSVDLLPTVVDTAFASTTAALSSMNPNISVILDVAGAWFSNDPIQSGAHDPSGTGFHLQQLELSMGASVDPFFRFDANIVFAQFGVELEEAYATSIALPFRLQARAGQMLTRFGRQNPTHPHTWRFTDQPLVLGKFMGSEGSRGLGAELSWLAPLPWFAEFLISTTEAGNACCARSFLSSSSLDVRSPADVLVTGALKQFFPLGDDLSLLWGLSGQSGPNPSGPQNRSEIFGTDLYLRWRPVGDPGRGSISFTGELMHRRRQQPRALLVDHGGYAQVIAQFLQQWEVGARAEAVSGVRDDPLDPSWSGLRTRYSVQGTFYPSHFSRLRLQAAYGAPGEGSSVVDQLSENNVIAVMIAFEVLVGAHASHTF